VSLLNILLGIGTSVLVTRSLGTEDYGNFSFIIAVFAFATQILNFGFFYSTGRLLVQSYNPLRTRQIYGATLILLAAIAVLLAISIFTYSLIDEKVEANGLASLFMTFIPFCFVFLFVPYFDNTLPGSNRITELAIARSGKKIAYLTLLTGFFFYQNLTLKTTLVSFFLSAVFIALLVVYLLKPSFSSPGKRLKDIWLVNRKFGIQVYYGSLAMVANSRLTPLIIAFFGLNNVGVGLFALAMLVANPLGLLPNTIATSYFKKFASYRTIPLKLNLITFTVSLIGFILFIVLIKPVIIVFFSEEFIEVVPIAKIVAAAVLFHGFADYLNRFLGAHGKGKILRNVSYITGATLLLCNVLLIPQYGPLGAAYAKLAASVTYFISIFIPYLTGTIRTKYSS
jgi:O-antigen/teichoic acid export membrane protein